MALGKVNEQLKKWIVEALLNKSKVIVMCNFDDTYYLDVGLIHSIEQVNRDMSNDSVELSIDVRTERGFRQTVTEEEIFPFSFRGLNQADNLVSKKALEVIENIKAQNKRVYDVIHDKIERK